MRRAAVVSAVVVLGASGGVALADGLPPTPTVPLPPVPPPPTLPIPTLPTPQLPLPSPPVRVPTASAPQVSQPTLPSAGIGSTPPLSSQTGGGSGASGSGSSSAYSSSAPSHSTHRSSISRLHTSRSWLAATGPKSKRTTVLEFRLARDGRVDFTVLQVSPACRSAGRFAVGGHSGLNRVHFNGKVHGRQLPPGTYRLTARTHGGSRLLHVILVIVSAGAPTPAELRAARHSDVCATARALAANAASNATGFGTASRPLKGAKKSLIVRHQNPSHGTPSATGLHNGTPSAAPFSPARVSQNAANPFVVAALAVAVLLLGLAALPQRAVPDPRLTDLLARHRIEVALTGAAALAGALLALALA